MRPFRAAIFRLVATVQRNSGTAAPSLPWLSAKKLTKLYARAACSTRDPPTAQSQASISLRRPIRWICLIAGRNFPCLSIQIYFFYHFYLHPSIGVGNQKQVPEFSAWPAEPEPS